MNTGTLHFPRGSLKLLRRKVAIKLYFDRNGSIIKVSYKKSRKQTKTQELFK